MRTPSFPWLLRLAIPLCLVALMVPAAIRAQTQTLPPASQVASQIRVGWNLGNTLEAICGETAWGNPMVTQQLINSVRAAGFNAIRIPASWDCHTNQSTLTIDPAWTARVKQVVDLAFGQGMYVIVNIHWDNGWLQDHPTFSFQDAVNRKQRAYWTQIATLFRDYNERLLFAGTNEVHADFGTPTSEHITVQQSYLQTFVDAVRATGGNNASRTLVVQTYNTNAQHGLNFFTMPRDSATGRLIVEFHYYDPYDYTLNPSGSCLFWGAPFPTQSACTWAYESYVNDLFAQVRAKWVAQGIPVIMGEYGVATRPNLDFASRQYYLEYINRTAAQNGIKTFYWDNGVLPSQSNGFALFNRNTGAITDQGALDAILRGAGTGNTPTPTRTRTPTGATATRTRTPTGTTSTPTPGSGATCSPATAITAPFTFDGAGTFCWQIATIPNNINSWNLASLTVNGASFTNTFAFSSNLPPKINGFWYISYTGNFSWSHFEAK
jgi:endoglucanase